MPYIMNQSIIEKKDENVRKLFLMKVNFLSKKTKHTYICYPSPHTHSHTFTTLRENPETGESMKVPSFVCGSLLLKSVFLLSL